jgi:hypothetical protein
LKLKALVIAAVFALGVVTSVAVAKGPPPGKGKHQTTSTSTSSTGTTTTADKHAQKKMWICHRTGSGKYVKLRINRKAWPAHQRHGDTSLEAAPGSTGTTATTATTGTTGKKQGAGSCAGAGPGSTTGTTTTSP